MTNIEVFIADDVNDEYFALLRDAGFRIEKQIRGLMEVSAEAIKNFDGLIVRSETKVSSNLMDKLPNLRVRTRLCRLEQH